MKLNLISNGNTNAKTVKNEAETYILYLSPYTFNSHGKNVCPWASPECAKLCLNTAGLPGVYKSIQEARRRKTDLMFDNPQLFFSQLDQDLNKIDAKAWAKGETIFVRLNGTSDIDFDKQLHRYLGHGLSHYSNLRFYDYTKNRIKAMNFIRYSDFDIYRVTYSRSENDKDRDIQELLSYGCNVAVVFSGELPDTYLGYPVIDGDKSDLRFNDPAGVVVGLVAKGKARNSDSEFVVKSNCHKNEAV
jgi:hypothetical protein